MVKVRTMNCVTTAILAAAGVLLLVCFIPSKTTIDTASSETSPVNENERRSPVVLGEEEKGDDIASGENADAVRITDGRKVEYPSGENDEPEDSINPRERRSTLCGTLSDGNTGDPLIGFKVIAARRIDAVEFSTSSDTDGDYWMKVPYGEYDIRVLTPDDETVLARSKVRLRDRVTKTINFDLNEGTILTGRITESETGKAVLNAKIEVCMYSDPREILAVGFSDARGYYLISLQSGGRFYIKARAENRQVREFDGWSVAEQETLRLDIALRPQEKGLVTGIVTDEYTSVRLSGALVRIYSNSVINYTVYTDAFGRYTAHVHPGRISIYCRMKGYDAFGRQYFSILSSREIPERGLTLNVALKPKDCLIYGIVLDGRTGLPIEGAKVTISKRGNPSTDRNGEYFIQIPAGKYIARARMRGYRITGPAAFELESGEERECSFSLEPYVYDAVISGRIYDAETWSAAETGNNGLAYAWPYFDGEYKPKIDQDNVVYVAPDNTGFFRLSVPGGDYKLEVKCIPGYLKYNADVSVAAGSNLVHDVYIERIPELECTITGVVVDEVTGQPVSGITVRAHWEGGERPGRFTTKDDGKYTLRTPSGKITITGWSGREPLTCRRVDLVLKPGETREITLKAFKSR